MEQSQLATICEEDESTQSSSNNERKRRRSKKQVRFIANQGRRRLFDRTKLESLATMLDEWFTRTKLPVVAVALEKNLQGDMAVRFIGKEVFADFVRDDDVRKKFLEVAIKGLASIEEKRNPSIDEPELNTNSSNILLRENFLKFSIHDKRSLLTEIVVQQGVKGTGSAWHPDKKPIWWNEDHWPFQSPNNGTPRMGVEALDALLEACAGFYRQKAHGEMESCDEEIREEIVETVMDVEVERQEEPSVEEPSIESIKLSMLCKDFAWSANSCEELMENVAPISSWSCATKLISHLPDSSSAAKMSKACILGDGDVDLWLRHLVPEKDRLDGLEPLMMQDDEQNIYRCISKGLFKSDALWAVLKLETLKYAISSESDMLSKLQHHKNITDLFGISRNIPPPLPGQVQDIYRNEILNSFSPRYRCSPVHLMLAAEALSLEVDISTAKIDEVCSFGEGAPVLKLMWAPVTLGGFPSKLVPLVNLDSSTFTTHHPATRSSSLALCAANDQCALTVGVSPSSKVLQCRHCLRQFHSTCCSVADDSVPGNIWFCGCAYAAKNLRNLQKFSSVRDVKKLLNTHRKEVKRYMTAMSEGATYCKRMKLFQMGAINLLRQERCQHWLLNSDTIEIVLKHCQTECSQGKLFLDVQGGDVVRLQLDVLLPEVLSFMVHLIEGIPILAARIICRSRPAETTIENTTPKKKVKKT